MSEIQLVIQNALVRYHRIQRQRAWLAGFAALAFVLGLTALLDQVWMFSGLARWSGWIVGLTVATWVARQAAGPTCSDTLTLAHRVESEAGETVPVVATAIDPAVRQAAGNESVAGLMIDRLNLRAAETLRVAPPTFRGYLRVPSLVAATAVAALVGLVALQGGNGLLRIIFPWQTMPYTSLTLSGPTDPLAEGKNFTLTARVSGVPVEKIILYRTDSLDPLSEAKPDQQGLVQLSVDGIKAPTEFFVRGGDGQSAPVRIEPYILPRIDAFDIAITPPAYTKSAAKAENKPSFSLLRSSRLHYRVRLKAPAVSVVFERSAAARKEERVTDHDLAQLQRDENGISIGVDEPTVNHSLLPVFHPDPTDPLIWEADFDTAHPEDIVYRLVIAGRHGDQVRNDEPWRINILADNPPVVRIDQHDGADVIHSGNETVHFTISAVDDLGLAKAWLISRKPGQPHTRQKIKLPMGTGRTWSGIALLALASLDAKPLDIIAVHVEVEDANTIDGPGVGRSEVVYLEIPPPKSADDEKGGGGEGSSPEPINPLALQLEILKATIGLPHHASASDLNALAHDQQQNMDFVGEMEEAATEQGSPELAALLHQSRVSMVSAFIFLYQHSPAKALPDEEAALGALIEAAKILEKTKQEPPKDNGDSNTKVFTLRPPTAKSSSKKEKSEKENKESKERKDSKGKKDQDAQKALRKLMEEVQRQLAEQEKLNQGKGDQASREGKQQSLAGDARSAASQASGLQATKGLPGDPKAAVAELERAAGLQDDAAKAVADGDAKTSAELGEKSSEALSHALRQLAAQLGSGSNKSNESNESSAGYERLINDYLRSISYE
jgi:hypothetical protein